MMGGPGSGNWQRLNRKMTVEKCFSIHVSDFSENISDCISGKLKWRNRLTGQDIASIGYLQLPEDDSEPMLILSYKIDGHSVEEPISFQKTNPHFGGNRWWFTCPMCKRRMGKLYLLITYRYFVCRKCCDLRYQYAPRSLNF
jgi:hypothetical protein